MAGWTLSLMILAAATEGAGLALAVPLAAAMIGTRAPELPWLDSTGPDVLLIGLVVLAILRAVLIHARTMAVQRLQIAIVDGLRSRAWRALLAADWRLLARQRRSDAASLLISEVDRVGYGMQQLLTALSVVLTLCALGLAALAIAPGLALVAGVAGGLVMLAFASLRRRARDLGQAIGQAYSRVHAALGEGLGALRQIKSLGGEVAAATAADQSFAALRTAQLDFWRAQGLGQIVLQGGGAAALALLLWLAMSRWQVSPVILLPLVALFVRAVPLLGALQDAWLQWTHTRPAIAAMQAMIDVAEAAREPDPGQQQAIRLEREIRLEQAGVQFGGSPRAVLTGIDLAIPALGIAALTGASGAGKSTLADLLGALISPDSGRLMVDGMTIDPGNRRAWRRRVAYVHQQPVMLAASLRDNLTWGRTGFDDAALIAALEAAAAQFALDLPQGLDTLLGDGGRILSGGEQQRIALARALLGNPDLLILDEATSALDPDSEAQVAEAITSLKGKVTMLVIAHRGRLTELADCTYRLEQGQLVN
jgi:ATP-binding cassette subfamily C protein